MLDTRKKIEIKSKLLYKFLKKHRCIRQYIENVLEQKKAISYPWWYERHNIFRLIQACTVNQCDINHSFIWQRTPQGHDYWGKLDRKFYKDWAEYVRQTEDCRKGSETPI